MLVLLLRFEARKWRLVVSLETAGGRSALGAHGKIAAVEVLVRL
jgi:hypothetical protein